MKVYRRKTREVIKRFRARRLSFPDCIGALNSALADLIPGLTGDQLGSHSLSVTGGSVSELSGCASRETQS
jgi:hypothetical protein